MRRIRGAAMVAACAMVVTLGTGTPALASVTDDPTTPPSAAVSASLPLPSGWSLDGSGALTWTSPTRIPLGDARLDVAVDGRALGVGELSHDQRSVSVQVAPDLLSDPSVDWSALSVTAAGRRLDAPATSGPRPQAVAPNAFSGELPPVAPLLAADPGTPGPYTTVTGEYSLAGVTIAGLPAKVEVKAVVVSPRGHHRPPTSRPLPARPSRDVLQGEAVDHRLAVPHRLHGHPELPGLPRDPEAARVAGLRHRLDLGQRHQRPGLAALRRRGRGEVTSSSATTSRCGSPGRCRTQPTPRPPPS